MRVAALKMQYSMTRIDELIFEQENKTEFILHKVPKQLYFKILRAVFSEVNSSCVGSLFPTINYSELQMQ